MNFKLTESFGCTSVQLLHYILYILEFLSKLLASLMRIYFPKWPSGSPLNTLSKLYDVPVGFVAPPLIWGSILLYMRSPMCGCCSISDDLSCSCSCSATGWLPIRDLHDHLQLLGDWSIRSRPKPQFETCKSCLKYENTIRLSDALHGIIKYFVYRRGTLA